MAAEAATQASFNLAQRKNSDANLPAAEFTVLAK
jgi:hypothetical protein